MLTDSELKTVVETLTKRRAALLQQCKDDPAVKEHNQTDIDLLESAVEKIKNACAAASENLPDLSPLRVLVAEDDAYSLKLMQAVLNDLNITKIDTAKDGSEALKLIFQCDKAYDIVLCDWNMPGKTGLQVHSTMRTDSRFKHTMFIVVSAVSESEQIRSAIQQGVNDYIVKPLDEEVMQKKIFRAYEKLKALKRF